MGHNKSITDHYIADENSTAIIHHLNPVKMLDCIWMVRDYCSVPTPKEMTIIVRVHEILS